MYSIHDRTTRALDASRALHGTGAARLSVALPHRVTGTIATVVPSTGFVEVRTGEIWAQAVDASTVDVRVLSGHGTTWALASARMSSTALLGPWGIARNPQTITHVPGHTVRGLDDSDSLVHYQREVRELTQRVLERIDMWGQRRDRVVPPAAVHRGQGEFHAAYIVSDTPATPESVSLPHALESLAITLGAPKVLIEAVSPGSPECSLPETAWAALGLDQPALLASALRTGPADRH